jgi:signal transduction histidine kinase
MDWDDALVSVGDAIDSAVAASHALALERQQRVVVKVARALPSVFVDPDKLGQIVINLLSNAFKFSPPGTIINIAAKRSRDEVIVSVEDHGVGIAPGGLAKVFERFKQVGDTLTEKPQGTGLGLPICKEIVEHYGGRIWVQSEFEAGSTFSFALPVSSA